MNDACTRFLRVSLFAAIAFVFVQGNLKAQETTKYSRAQLQQIYMDFLKKEGYVPEIDKDGDVQFKSEGSTFWIIVIEDDPEYFRLLMPNFWPIESEEERLKVLRVANEATAGTKVAKVFMEGDNVVATMEIFVESPEGFRPVFSRGLSALHTSVREFVNKMRE